MTNVWASSVTKAMTNDLTEKEVERLSEELNNAVTAICQDYGIKG
jgi:hypothetical protein